MDIGLIFALVVVYVFLGLSLLFLLRFCATPNGPIVIRDDDWVNWISSVVFWPALLLVMGVRCAGELYRGH